MRAGRRYGTRFTGRGTRAACLVDTGPTLDVEVWDLTGPVGRAVRLPVPGGESLLTQVLPLPCDRALVLRHHSDRHELVLLSPDGPLAREVAMATLRTPGFRLITPTVATTWAPAGDTTFWRIRTGPPGLQRLATVRGEFTGGVALSATGGLLGFTRREGGEVAAVAVDTRTGHVRDLAPGVPAHLLLADPRSGRVIMAVPGAAGARLAHLALRGPEVDRLVFPAATTAADEPTLPLAVAPGGTRLALQVTGAVRSRLLVHDLTADELTEVPLPPGTLGAAGAWTDDGLRLAWSAADCPSGIATLDPDVPGSWRVDGTSPAPEGGSWSAAHVEQLPGAAGPVEAVVHGDWRTAERVVVALHGGPEAHWDLDFHPQLQLLARAGFAVVAPNQRGSTGYGPAHAGAITGAWGGPDLDDVVTLGRALRSGRHPSSPAPAVVGESYGGYLALLAAAHAPDAWSRCAAISPFLSGARLHADAAPAVRSLIERLGGDTPFGGDVEVVLDRIRGPLLVLHGSDDPTVPIAQSRRLRTLAARHGTALIYREIAGVGHDPLADPAAADTLVRFLDGSPLPAAPSLRTPVTSRSR
jgi:pimeloyl-ACP methyl ester carboxylesterase